MNMLKKNGGFTLVELIVVIAILAILAGIAVPAYSGYIAKAEEAADTTSLAAIKTATMAAMATKGEVKQIIVVTDGKGVITEVKANPVEVTTGEGESTSTSTEYTWMYSSTDTTKVDSNFWTYINEDLPELSYYVEGATWYVAESAAGVTPEYDAGWNAGVPTEGEEG